MYDFNFIVIHKQLSCSVQCNRGNTSSLSNKWPVLCSFQQYHPTCVMSLFSFISFLRSHKQLTVQLQEVKTCDKSKYSCGHSMTWNICLRYINNPLRKDVQMSEKNRKLYMRVMPWFQILYPPVSIATLLNIMVEWLSSLWEPRMSSLPGNWL